MRIDYTHYENSYANTSNHEVLLNLARLAQHDPTYFFQLGQISSTYQMQAGLSGNGSYVPQGASTGIEVPTGGGTPTAAYQNYSAFNFIPVSSEANARLLLTTIPEDEFYNLYQQGWRVDQLFRLMVDRIEITMPPDADHPNQKSCRVEVIRNVPPPSYYAPGYEESARNLTRYVTFLRVSAIVYELQKHGLLQIGGSPGFSALDKKSGLDGEQSLTAKDIVDAAANNEVWEWSPPKDKEPGKWLLGKKVQHPRFVLSSLPPEDEPSGPAAQGQPPVDLERQYGDNVAAQEAFLDDLFKKDKSLVELTPTLNNLPGMSGYDPNQPSSPGAPELTDILEILYRGFAIGGTPTETGGNADNEIGPCTPPDASSPGSTAAGAATAQSSGTTNGPSAPNSPRPVSSRLVMRSLLGVMAAAAQEQESFDMLMKVNPDIHMELWQASSSTPGTPGLMCAIHNDLAAGASDNKGVSTPGGQLGIAALCAKSKGQPNPTFKFNQLVPAIEQLPVLRLRWSKDVSPGPAQDSVALMRYGLAVNYRGANYWVTDFKVPDGDSKHEMPESPSGVPAWAEENQSWNRDVFRLTTELTSQLSVDISKFPLPAVLQLPIQ